MSIKLAILDDYQRTAVNSADWDKLGEDIIITVFDCHLGHDESVIVEALLRFDILICMRERTRFPAHILAKLKNLKLLVTTGMRNLAIDLEAARSENIMVCGTEMLGYPAAEHTIALILDLFKKISSESQVMRRGGWQENIAEGLNGKILGLLGFGKLGKRVARVAQALEMEVTSWSENLTEAHCKENNVKYVDKETLFRTADVLSIHLVLSARTRGIVAEKELSWMKSDAYIVNTSRGPIIEEKALIAALSERSIAGAGLDVFDVEPLPQNHPLRQMDNAVLTGHTGYVIRELWSKAYNQAVENVIAWRAGFPIRVLNKE